MNLCPSICKSAWIFAFLLFPFISCRASNCAAQSAYVEGVNFVSELASNSAVALAGFSAPTNSNVLSRSDDENSFFKVELPANFSGIELSPNGQQAVVWQPAIGPLKALRDGKALPIGESGNLISVVDLGSRKIVKTKELGFQIAFAACDAQFVYVVSAEKPLCVVLDKLTLNEKGTLKAGSAIRYLKSDDKSLRMDGKTYRLPELKEVAQPLDTTGILLRVADVSTFRSRAGIVQADPVNLDFVTPPGPDRAPKRRLPKRKEKEAKFTPYFKSHTDTKKIDSQPLYVTAWTKIDREVKESVLLKLWKPTRSRGRWEKKVILGEKNLGTGDPTTIQIETHKKKAVVLAGKELFVCDVKGLAGEQLPNNKFTIVKPKPTLVSAQEKKTIPILVKGEKPFTFGLTEDISGIQIKQSGFLVVDAEELRKHCQQVFAQKMVKQYQFVKGFSEDPAEVLESYLTEVGNPLLNIARNKISGLPLQISVGFKVVDSGGLVQNGQQKIFVGVSKEEVLTEMQEVFESKGKEIFAFDMLQARVNARLDKQFGTQYGETESKNGAAKRGTKSALSARKEFFETKSKKALILKILEMESRMQDMEKQLNEVKRLKLQVEELKEKNKWLKNPPKAPPRPPGY